MEITNNTMPKNGEPVDRRMERQFARRMRRITQRDNQVNRDLVKNRDLITDIIKEFYSGS